MGTTARRGYPYPEDSDLVIQGDDAIQALAEKIDLDVDWTQTVAHIGLAESPSATGGLVDFGPAVSLMTGFTYTSGGTLTYTGPASRMFVVCVSVEVTQGGTGASFQSSASVNHNGAEVGASYDLVATPSGGVIEARGVVHNIATFVLLAPGDTVTVSTTAGPAGTVGRASIKLQPIGGRG